MSPHIPVLLDEVIASLQPVAGAVFYDGTFGAGGYSRALLEAGAARVIGVDRDPTAIAGGEALVASSGGRLTLVHGTFANVAQNMVRAGVDHIDGAVFDVGVSSMQLDQAERGFSFRGDGPLDMRMSLDGPSAADIVNTLAVPDLAHVLRAFGEERHAGRIARAIEERRREHPFTRTGELVAVIEKVMGAKRFGELHPATRSFQAIRILVNRELDELSDALGASEAVLGDGGRLAIVSFHSLEDRIVKRFFADRSRTHAQGSRHLPDVAVAPPTFAMSGRQPVEAGDAELERNPRARSAKLRFGIRTTNPARPIDRDMLGVPAFELRHTRGAA